MSNTIESFFGAIRGSSQELKSHPIIRKRLSNNGPAYIVPLGDIHVGHTRSNLNLLKQVTDFILQTDNCYTVLIGDLAECATKTSVGMGLFDESMHVREQTQLLLQLLKPLARAEKIIGAVMGNHEYRYHQISQSSPVTIICDALEIPYFDYQGFAELYVGETTYETTWHHGVGGGATEGSKVNSAMRQLTVVQADLYIGGHTHARSAVESPIAYFEGGQIKQKIRHIVTIGSFLEYFGNYPQMKLLPISPTGPVLIELRHDNKEIHVYK